MRARIVKILRYDPVKGSGYYEDGKGEHRFTYRMFHDQKMIPSGTKAVLTSDGVLRPATFKHRVKGAFGRVFKWQ